jgi:hypothetical protein
MLVETNRLSAGPAKTPTESLTKGACTPMADPNRIHDRAAVFAEQLSVESIEDGALNARRVMLEARQVGRVRYAVDSVDGPGWVIEVWNGVDDFEDWDHVLDHGRDLALEEVDRQTVGAVALALAEGDAHPRRDV